MKKIIAGIVSFVASYGMIYYLVMPTLQNYPRLDRMAQRFEYMAVLLAVGAAQAMEHIFVSFL